MSLRLRIENVDNLPDGGPISFEVAERGLDIGRDPYLDWTLPDPDRFISGKHCEIRYRDGGYWLHDVSTNGTSLNGQGGRLTEPHLLQNGDRVHIGHYIIAVEVTEVARDALPGAMGHADPGSPAPDPWGVENAAAAVERRDFSAFSQPDRGEMRRPTDLSEENISWSVGDVAPGQGASDDDIWGAPADDSGDGGGGDEWAWAPPEAPAAPAAAPSVPVIAAPPEGEPESIPVPSAGEGVLAVAPDTLESPADPFAAPDAGDDPEPAAGEDGAEMPPPMAGPVPEPFAPEPSVQPAPTETEAVPLPVLPASDTSDSDPFGADIAEPPPDQIAAAPAGLAGRWADDAGADIDIGADAGADEAAPAPRAADSEAPEPALAEGQGRADQGRAASGFIAAFERGAGIPAGSVASSGEDAFAEELGALFKLVTQNLQTLLAARAETKSAMRSADRTMIGALENNPLKFSPTAEDALRIMFGAKTRSYLDATETMEASFRDLQQHQVQTFAAMQHALQALIEDLDPQSIEKATATEGGLAGIVGSRRARLWDVYVERFRAKSMRHERGMIDSFMILFAEMYDRQR